MRNKKGIFFTILVISMLSLFAVYYSFNIATKDREPINKRIETMNNFVALVERDLPRQIYISGYREIVLLEKRIADNGTYISDLNGTFQELFTYGTMYGEGQDMMIGATFSDIQKSLNDTGDSINVRITISDPSINLTQDNPWKLKVTLKAYMKIEDKGNLASWNRSITVDSYIPIDRFEDPFYVIGTGGKWNKKINQTIYTGFVTSPGDTGDDFINLSSQVNNSYYKSSTTAPSFLDRLQGKYDAENQYGIESLVYLPALSSIGLEIKQKSCVDYIYFSTNNPSSSMIDFMPDWFRVDDSHLVKYNVNGLTR